jgi:hypothetical protein
MTCSVKSILMRRSIVFYSVCFALLGVLRGWSQIISPSPGSPARPVGQTADAKPVADPKRELEALAWAPPASGMDTQEEVSPAQRKFGGDAEHYAQSLAELLEMTSLGFRDPGPAASTGVATVVESGPRSSPTLRVTERSLASTAPVGGVPEVDLSQENAVRDPAQVSTPAQALEIEPLADSSQSNL